MNEHQPVEHADLPWLAFQYANDLLSAEDRESFESRLAEEQEAREAVAEAVELLQTTSAAMHERAAAKVSLPMERRTRLPAGSLAAIGGAVALLVLLFAAGLGLNSATSERAQLPGAPLQDAAASATDADLAMIWGELIDQQTTNASASEVETLEVLVDEEIGAEDWMLAALASMETKTSQEE